MTVSVRSYLTAGVAALAAMAATPTVRYERTDTVMVRTPRCWLANTDNLRFRQLDVTNLPPRRGAYGMINRSNLRAHADVLPQFAGHPE